MRPSEEPLMLPKGVPLLQNYGAAHWTFDPRTDHNYLRGANIVYKCFLGALLISTAALNIAMITVGSLHVNDCPALPALPILMIVLGCLSLVVSFVTSLSKPNRVEAILEPVQTQVKYYLQRLLSLAILTAFIVMACHVYQFEGLSIDGPQDQRSSGLYCDATVYLFCLWFVSIILSLIGLSVLVFLFITCGCYLTYCFAV